MSSAMSKLRVLYNRFPRLAWTVTLALVGYILGGVLLGTMGLAIRGTAVPVYGSLVVAALGAYIGFRVGEWRLRKRGVVVSSADA